MRLLVLVYGLLIAQRILGSYIPVGWPHPQLMIPLCVYLGMTRFSPMSALVVSGSGLFVDALSGPILGPWAGASVAAFLVGGAIAGRGTFSSVGLIGVMMLGGALVSFGVFHAMHLADTSLVPSGSLIVGESFVTAVAGTVGIPAIRWWLEPKRGRSRGDARHGARHYA